MKRISKLLIISILIFFSFYAFYSHYSKSLINRLVCNQIFKPREESFNNEVLSSVNYKFFKWESERLDCDHSRTLEKRTLEFLNDSTVLIFTKYDRHEGWNYFFPIKFLFDLNEFIGKRYDLYSVNNDTIWRNIDKKDYFDEYYFWNKDSIIAIEIPPYKFIPYKEWTTFKIEKQKLNLSYFRRE